MRKRPPGALIFFLRQNVCDVATRNGNKFSFSEVKKTRKLWGFSPAVHFLFSFFSSLSLWCFKILFLIWEAYHEQILWKNFFWFLMKSVTSLTCMIDGSCDVLTSFSICFHQSLLSIFSPLWSWLFGKGAAHNPLGAYSIQNLRKIFRFSISSLITECKGLRKHIQWCLLISPQMGCLPKVMQWIILTWKISPAYAKLICLFLEKQFSLRFL